MTTTPQQLFQDIVHLDDHALFYDDASAHLKYSLYGQDIKTRAQCTTHLKNILKVLQSLEKVKENRVMHNYKDGQYSDLILPRSIWEHREKNESVRS